MKITVNRETISKEICEQEIRNKKRENPHLKEDEVKKIAEQSVIDWTIIRQNATKEITSIPTQLIENEYENLIVNSGGEEQFLKRYNLKKEDVPKVKKDIEQNIKVKQFLKRLTQDVREPSDEEIEKYYHEHKQDYTIPEQVHAAHIVMQLNPANPKVAFNEMKEIRQRLLDGESFAALADEHSSCQDEGGDLGFFSPGKMVEAFDTIVFSMNVGEISPVFQTQFGYHIATVYEKKPPQLKPLEECRDDIVDKLKTNEGDALIADWVDNQKEKVDIKVVDE